MHKEVFLALIEKILAKKITKEEIWNCLVEDVDCVEIYDSDDLLLSDAYFTLTHFASGEEKIEDKEWIYLLECLKDERIFSFKDKMRIFTDKPSNEQP